MKLTKEILTAFVERKARVMERFVQNEIDSRFKLDVIRYRFKSTSRNVSRGGVRYSRKGGRYTVVSMININVAYMVNRLDTQTWMFTEYEHVAERMDIGSRGPVGWQEYLTILLAHEIAHAVEFNGGLARENELMQQANSAGFSAADPKAYKVKGHGFVWQWIYKLIRDEFFNKGFVAETVTVPEKRSNSMTLLTRKVAGGTIYLTADCRYVVAVVSKGVFSRVSYSSKGLLPVVKDMVLSFDVLDKHDYVNDGRKARARVYEIYKGMQ